MTDEQEWAETKAVIAAEPFTLEQVQKLLSVADRSRTDEDKLFLREMADRVAARLP